MSKSRGKKSRLNLIAIIIFVGALSYAGFRYLYPPKPANIFLINPVPIQYGDTTVVGTLRKDAPVGKPGTYLLVLSDSRAILLDVKGLDNLLGLSISVTGYLLPADGDTPMSMTVNTITTQ